MWPEVAQRLVSRCADGVALYNSLSNIFSGSSGNIVPATPAEYYIQSLMVRRLMTHHHRHECLLSAIPYSKLRHPVIRL